MRDNQLSTMISTPMPNRAEERQATRINAAEYCLTYAPDPEAALAELLSMLGLDSEA